MLKPRHPSNIGGDVMERRQSRDDGGETVSFE
jgi:hypothetical protein